MKLIYITEGVGAVFQSQVVELLNSMVERDINIDITLLVGIRKKEEKLQITNLHKNIKLSFFKSINLYPILDIVISRSLKKELKKIHITPDTIIHTRGEYMGALFYKIFKTLYSYEPKLLIDFRGAGIEEISMYVKKTIRVQIKILYLKYLYNKYTNKAYLLNSVTVKLKNYLMNTYHFPEKKIYVNHCIAGEPFRYDIKIRDKIRKKLGIKDNETLFVFSTSSAGGKWQNGDEIAIKLTNLGYKVLMLSRKKYNINGVISRYVPYEEVAEYLMAADIGIVIRNDDIVNNVASPIKFGEYISCGLPVIANDSVDLITDTINKHKYGLIVDNLEKIEDKEVLRLRSLDRNKISKLGIHLFGIETISNGYSKMYNSILKYDNEEIK